MHISRRGHATIQHEPRGHLSYLLLGNARPYGYTICFWNMALRMHHGVCEGAVIRHEQQAFRFPIQPPYRIHSHSAILYKFRNAFTIHLIAHGCDKTARLVQHDITERLLFRNLSPIDGNRVSFRIDFIPNLSSGTIDLYTPLRNQHFALTT